MQQMLRYETYAEKCCLMQHSDASEIIKRAKSAHGLKTDQDLADFLAVPRSTIAAWKRRGSIPMKHLAKMATDSVSLDWLLSGEGEARRLDELGIPEGAFEATDHDILIIAIGEAINSIADYEEEEFSKMAERFSPVFIYLLATCIHHSYGQIVESKRKWLESSIIDEFDVIEALKIEYNDLGYRSRDRSD